MHFVQCRIGSECTHVTSDLRYRDSNSFVVTFQTRTDKMRVNTHFCQNYLVGNSYIVNWSWHIHSDIEYENNLIYRLNEI